MIDESTIDDWQNAGCDLVGGCVGQVLIDNNPHATPGRVRPFVWSYLLLRGAVRRCEVVGALTGHVSEEDIRCAEETSPDDIRTSLEIIIDTVLGEMVHQGLLRLARRDDDLFVLDPLGLQQAVSLVCQLNAQLPDHLLHEFGHETRTGQRADATPAAPAPALHEGNEGSGLHGRWVGHRFRAVVRLRQLLRLAWP